METTRTIQAGASHPTLARHEQRKIGLELQATPVELVDYRLGPLDLARQDVQLELVRALEQQLWMMCAERAH